MVAGLNFLGADVRFRRQHTAQQRLLRHFEREDGDDFIALDGRVLRDVDGQRSLTHGGPSGNDGELGGLQARGHLIELRQEGAEAGDLVLALLVKVVDALERAGDDLVDAGEAAGDAFLGDFKQRSFGGVEDLERLLTLVGRTRDGSGADVDELAQEGFVLDDADVFLNGDATRKTLSEGGKPRNAADGFDFLTAGELFADGDDVDHVVAVDEFAHAAEYALMRGKREVLGAQERGGFAVGMIVEQDGAEDGALGVQRGGKAALEFDVGGGGHALIECRT